MSKGCAPCGSIIPIDPHYSAVNYIDPSTSCDQATILPTVSSSEGKLARDLGIVIAFEGQTVRRYQREIRESCGLHGGSAKRTSGSEQRSTISGSSYPRARCSKIATPQSEAPTTTTLVSSIKLLSIASLGVVTKSAKDSFFVRGSSVSL